MGDNYETLVYYVNSNNGGTRFSSEFDETVVHSIRNRAVIVKGKVLHESVTQTDTNFRFLVNINFSSDQTQNRKRK